MSGAQQQSARDAILQAVRAARPPAVARPAARVPATDRANTELSSLDGFVSAATTAGAHVVIGARDDVPRLARGVEIGGEGVYSLVSGVPSTSIWAKRGSDSFAEESDPSTKESDPRTELSDPHALASLDLFVCEATLGVAENGAVWIATSDSWQRAALFLAQRVVIVVGAETIVADLHEAYARIDVRAERFGVFVAGPSKTADIEQSLVIGAHGPKELTVIVVKQPADSTSTTTSADR